MTEEEYQIRMREVKGWPYWLLLSATIYGEARGESFQGKVAVGFVMDTRQKDNLHWNDILSPWQFSCWNKDDPNLPILLDKLSVYDPAYQDCISVANQIIGRTAVNPVPKADHYCNVSVFPSWSKDMQDLGIIGRHKFFNSKAQRA